MRATVTGVSDCVSVFLSVDCVREPCKTTEPIEMLCGIKTRVDPGNTY